MQTTNYEFIGWDALLYEWAPKVIGAVLILIAAWFIGKAVKWALAKGINRIPGAAKASTSDNPKHSIGASLGDVAFWLILLFGVVAALGVLNLGQVVTPLNSLLTQVASFVPSVLGAVLIFFIGFVVATSAKRVVEAALQAANADRWLEKAGLTKTDADAFLGAFQDVLVENVAKGETVKITGLMGVERVERAARTGKIGDGKIFVADLNQVIRIRTGETGNDAL